MKRVGLALGSGGARGYAHIGVIKVLQEHNIPIDCVAGTSMGAIMAAYFALYLDMKEAEKIGLSIRRRDMLKFMDFNDPRVSLIKAEKIKDYLRSLFGDRTFRDTKIPLRIGATRLEDGKQVVFKSGRLIDAIMASGTVPGIMPPYNYKGQMLVDGGLTEGLPIRMVEEAGAEVVIGVDLYSYDNYKCTDYNIKQVLERSYQLMMTRLSVYHSKGYEKNILVLKPIIEEVDGTFSFHHARANILAGEVVARENISKIKRLVR